MKKRDLFVHAGVCGLLGAAAIVGVSTAASLAQGSSGSRSVLVPITPCRLADTRSGSDNVGTRSTPLQATETHTFQVWGHNGNCDIPATATGIATNVTAVNPTADSYLTVFPADAPRPLASNLNWTKASAPTPNQVTVGLSGTGAVSAYNNAGKIDVIVDIVGYYEAAGTAAQGAQGPQGPAGPPGSPGPQGEAGLAHLTTRLGIHTFTDTGSTGEWTSVEVQCESGESVTGGGVYMTGMTTSSGHPNLTVQSSGPIDADGDPIFLGTGPASGWAVSVYRADSNFDNGSTYVAYALCAATAS